MGDDRCSLSDIPDGFSPLLHKLLFMNVVHYGNMPLMDNFLLRFMNYGDVFLMDEFLFYEGLNMLMNHVLVVLVHNIQMLLFHHILVMFHDHILVEFCFQRSCNFFSKLGTLCMGYKFLALVDILKFRLLSFSYNLSFFCQNFASLRCLSDKYSLLSLDNRRSLHKLLLLP